MITRRVDQPLSLRLSSPFWLYLPPFCQASALCLSYCFRATSLSPPHTYPIRFSLSLHLPLFLSCSLSLFPSSPSASLGIVPSFSFLLGSINPSLLPSRSVYRLRFLHPPCGLYSPLFLSFSLSLSLSPFISFSVLSWHPLCFSRYLVLPLSRPPFEAHWRRFDFTASLCVRDIVSLHSSPTTRRLCVWRRVSELYATPRGSGTWCNLAPPDGVHLETLRPWIRDAFIGRRSVTWKREREGMSVLRAAPVVSSHFPSFSVSHSRLRVPLQVTLCLVQVRLRSREFATETPRWRKLLIRRVVRS